jgi:ubiquinone/menaquinone biosynthesis C-methylase UbiE
MNQANQPVSPDLYTEEYFRSACEGFDEFNESEGQRLSRRLDAAFAIAEISPGMKVLDVGCGRGEILLHCARLGADAYGVDYAPVAVAMSQQITNQSDEQPLPGKMGVGQADAKHLPFPTAYFDRVLMFDVVEHLYPWELQQAMLEVSRVLKPNGKFVVHTAPNIWYDKYAYPLVRSLRRLQGKGEKYPANPREFLVAHNNHVHVNEQSALSMWQALRQAGFTPKVWLDSPPQPKEEKGWFALLRQFVFRYPPFRWYFEREVFAVANKRA